MNFKTLRFLLFTLFLCILFSASAQKITVKDKLTNLPIDNVLIYNSTAQISSFQTNEKGQVVLNGLSENDIINFQHASYESFSIKYGELKNINYMILLSERIIAIEEVTVSANKWKEDISEVPNEILTLNAKNVSFINPQTSADLLAGSGEVFVQKSQLGGGSPMLRGFAANSVLLVVDGVRMNNAIYRNGNLQNIINIDPNALSSAEVLFGPGSVIYGSDALGGVMNFLTVNPKLSSSKKRYLRGASFTRYSTAANEKTGHLHFELGKKNISLFSSATWTDFDDLLTGSNRTDRFPDFGKRPFYYRRINGEDQLIRNENENLQVDSGYRLLNLINKIRFRPSEYLDLDYSHYYSTTSNIPRYDRLTQTNTDGTLRNAEWYYGPQNWQMHRIGLNSYKKNKFYDQLKVIGGYQDYEESRNDRRAGNNNLRNQSEQVDIFSINIDIDKETGNGNLYYGAEWLLNDVSSEATSTDIESDEVTPTATRYPDEGSTYRSISAYLNYKHRLSQQIIINTGVRYSNVKLKAETSDANASFLNSDRIDLQKGAINGTAGLVWKKNKNTTFSALFSSGFRAPNVDDVGKVFEIDGDEIVVPNADLRPEFSYNTELSYKKNITEKLTFDLVVYHSWLSNFIARDVFEVNGSSNVDINGETFTILAQQNFAGARIYGFGIKVNYVFDNFWALSGSFNLTDGKETETNVPLRHTPPFYGKTSLIYRNNKFKIEGFIDYSGSKKFEDLAPSEQSKTDIYTEDGSLGWITFNMKSFYQINKVLSLAGGVENIADTHYRTYSSGISAPGRNYIISLTAQF